MKQSAGIMVNYKYNLQDVEKNNEGYVQNNVIPVDVGLTQWL